MGVSADCGGGKEGGAVQVHREGKLLHEHKESERGGMALAATSTRLIPTKNIAKSSLLSSSPSST